MTTKPIVAATDGSEESLRAAEWAAREAALHGAPLRIVATAELLPRMSPIAGGTGLETVADILRENRDRALNAAAKRAAAATPGLVIDTDPLSGPVAQAVADSGSGALMLVVGSRGSGAFAAMILGSVSRYAATHASCAVAVIRDETMMPHRRVGVGIRDAATSQDALAFAFEEASLRQAALLASWQAKYPSVQVSQEIVHGHPGHALAGLSARSDLTVLGGHASGGSAPRGPATVTHAVLSHAHGPVVAVPSSR